MSRTLKGRNSKLSSRISQREDELHEVAHAESGKRAKALAKKAQARKKTKGKK